MWMMKINLPYFCVCASLWPLFHSRVHPGLVLRCSEKVFTLEALPSLVSSLCLILQNAIIVTFKSGGLWLARYSSLGFRF